MALESEKEMKRIVEQLRARPGLAEELPPPQNDIVRAALDGDDVHTIASKHGMDEAAIWRILDDAARWATGHPPARSNEQAGLGSTTEPGIHSGYGDTGFGSIGNTPPSPPPEEPRT